LGKRQGQAVTYLDVLEGRHTIRYAAEPGDSKPLHSSAIGKAMLGSLEPGQLPLLLKKLPLPAITPNTLTTRTALAEEIAAGRQRGWFMTKGENVHEVMALSIARSVCGEWYGVAVAGPLSRLELQQESLIAALLKAGAALNAIDIELRGRI
jgi:DNA-binding IclR family transcriptional regulator